MEVTRGIAVWSCVAVGCGPALVGDEGDTTTGAGTSGESTSAVTRTTSDVDDGTPGDEVTTMTTAGSADTTSDPTATDSGITTDPPESSDSTAGAPDPIALDECSDPPQFAVNELMLPDAASTFDVLLFHADDDGALDLVATDVVGRVWLWRGSGNGYFEVETQLPVEVGAQPHDIAAGDVDEDGIADLVAADHVGERLWLWMADGLGGYLEPNAIDVDLQPWTLSLDDLDADGHLDLTVLIDRDSGYVLAGFGDGEGTFAPAAEFAVQGGPAEYAVGDLDLDGALDAFGAGASNGLLVRQNLGGGFFDNAANLPFDGDSHSALAADLGADAWPELVVSATDDGGPRLFVWTGAVDFAYDASTEVITPFALRDLVATDLGGSAHHDVAAIGNDGEITTLWLARDWDDPCQAAIPVLEGTGQRLTPGDLDGDGDADFAIAMGPRLAFLLQE